jgi:hypothetical protein
MSPRTLTAPPDDRSMWRRALAKLHPDGGGSHDLFIWAGAVRDVVCSSEGANVRAFTEDPQPDFDSSRRREASTSATADRVPFDQFADFEVLTDRAVTMAATVAEPYGYLLRQVADCYPASSEAGPLHDQQRCGASYKSLAAIGHRAGMTKPERVQWYRIAEAIPLSQRHAGHILSKLQKAAA